MTIVPTALWALGWLVAHTVAWGLFGVFHWECRDEERGSDPWSPKLTRCL